MPILVSEEEDMQQEENIPQGYDCGGNGIMNITLRLLVESFHNPQRESLMRGETKLKDESSAPQGQNIYNIVSFTLATSEPEK